MPQTRQNLHNFGRVFWKAQVIDPLQDGKALRKRGFIDGLDYLNVVFPLIIVSITPSKITGFAESP